MWQPAARQRGAHAATPHKPLPFRKRRFASPRTPPSRGLTSRSSIDSKDALRMRTAPRHELRYSRKIKIAEERTIKRSAVLSAQLRGNLKDNAVVHRSACGRCAVHIAVLVEHDVAPRIGSVGAAGKVVKRGVRPTATAGSQLENRAMVICSVPVRRAVKIACAVESEVGNRPRAELAAGSSEAIEQGESPPTV